MKSIETLNQKLNPLRHFKPKQKQLFRLGCAALALALAVGTVPFLRGWAANEQAVVSEPVQNLPKITRIKARENI